jgi:hypothetical protein
MTTIAKTRPKTARQAAPDVAEILARRASESVALLDAAETILMQLAREEPIDGNARALLLSLGFDRDKQAREVGRLKRVLHHQARAASQAERDKAEVDARAAAEILATRGPEIEQELARLQNELATLARAAETAARTVEGQQQSVQTLRDRELLPEHIRAEYDAARQEFNQTFGTRIGALKSEIATTEHMGALDLNNLREARVAVSHGESLRLEVFLPKRPEQTHTIDPARWSRYIAQRRADDVARLAQIEQIEAEAESLAQRQRDLLSFYVPE